MVCKAVIGIRVLRFIVLKFALENNVKEKEPIS